MSGVNIICNDCIYYTYFEDMKRGSCYAPFVRERNENRFTKPYKERNCESFINIHNIIWEETL